MQKKELNRRITRRLNNIEDSIVSRNYNTNGLINKIQTNAKEIKKLSFMNSNNNNHNYYPMADKIIVKYKLTDEHIQLAEQIEKDNKIEEIAKETQELYQI